MKKVKNIIKKAHQNSSSLSDDNYLFSFQEMDSLKKATLKIKIGQPIYEIMERYNVSAEEAIEAYYN